MVHILESSLTSARLGVLNTQVEQKCEVADSAGLTDDLIALSIRARAFADALDSIVAKQRPRTLEAPTVLSPHVSDSTGLVTLARRYLRHRRRRDSQFPANLFADPAWDLLLDLYVAAVERRRISISSACIAAAVPSTTALRWITLLEAKGLVLRIADVNDRRRTYLAIAPGAFASIEMWLQGMQDVCDMSVV